MAVAQMTYTPDKLADEQYISLTTFRKNGNAVPTPVWFLQRDGKIFVKTSSVTGKVKRLRNNGHITFSACDARGVIHGEEFKGQAILHAHDSAFTQDIDSAMTKKYGILKRLIDFAGRFRSGDYVFIEITPS